MAMDGRRGVKRLSLALWLLAAILITSPAHAAGTIKIGFIASLSGPQGVNGQELLDGFKLALARRANRLGGLETELVIGDDQSRPDIGRQLAEKMLESDKVDLITGITQSNVVLAVIKPVADAKSILIGQNGGPSQLAGKGCSPYFFSASWQNDGVHEAMGQYLQEHGVKRVYLMAPNYPAGKDGLAGFKRYYKGEIVGEVYTQFGQVDYAAELAELRAKKPDALYFFYTGGMGINFLKQFAQSGLRQEIPLYGPSYSLDQTILPGVGEAAVGAYASAFWSSQLDNADSKAFVEAFRASHGRLPAAYAAQAYDAANWIDAAASAVGGKIDDKEAFRKAFETARFASVRGPFRLNANHFPIESFYLTQIETDGTGGFVDALRATIFTDHTDAYAGECRMRP
jgi:branched-chain amino acid transport system substrate-binding protein